MKETKKNNVVQETTVSYESRLQKNFFYYLKNQEDLVKQYNGKFLVIVDQKVVGCFADNTQALEFGYKNYEYGTFLIQECSEGDKAYTIHCHSIIC
ncbi:MAG: hypothetical protein MJ204_00645 [Bacteroidales bacterium]|nr:hypothetical protein [Bacteroidales bacterium]